MLQLTPLYVEADFPTSRYHKNFPTCPNVRPALSSWDSRTTHESGNTPSGLQLNSDSLVTGSFLKSMCFTLAELSTRSMRIKIASSLILPKLAASVHYSCFYGGKVNRSELK
jgi:hypothetical protein